jgi:hypothetical protein
MTDKDLKRRYAYERGEGNGKFILYLAFIAVLAWLAIQNLPIYFKIQNLRHDLAELARGAGAQGVPVDKVQKEAVRIAGENDVPTKDVSVTKDGPNLKITLNTVRTLNLIVTQYEWKINEQFDGRQM